MLDRASKFSDPQILRMLQNDFVPVAIDQWYQRRQKDAEGDFFQSIAKQGPRPDMNSTTQGSYIASASGKLIDYNNNYGPDRIRKMMNSALAQKHDWSAEPLGDFQPDPEFVFGPSNGNTVIQVNSCVLDGYSKARSEQHRAMQNSIGRDNLWITAAERQSLADNVFPDSLANKIARFHLIDNTRGEPPMWEEDDVHEARFEMSGEGVVTGKVSLNSGESGERKRSFDANVFGHVELRDGMIQRFDLVVSGVHQGHGQWNGGAPTGKFPLAIAFRVASQEDISYSVRPQALKAFGPGYLEFGK